MKGSPFPGGCSLCIPQGEMLWQLERQNIYWTCFTRDWINALTGTSIVSFSAALSWCKHTHTWTGLPTPPLPWGMSAVSLLLVSQAGRKQRRLLLDSHFICILQLSLPESSECCGLADTCLTINKMAVWSPHALSSWGTFSIGWIQRGGGMTCWWASLESWW